MPLISIVVPCCNEQESLPIFLKELDSVVHTIAKMIPASPLRRSRVRLHRHAATGIRCAVVVGAALDSRDGEFWKSGHDDEAADAEAKVVFRMVDPGLSENDSE